MKHYSSLKLIVTVVLGMASLVHGQRAGDEWTAARGDETPGLRYFAATTTSSGRIVAVGDHGKLMISDDGGVNWRFDQIEIDGFPMFGTVTTVYQIPGGSLIAVLVRMEEATEGPFKYQARSYFLTSANNGSTWSMSPFPKTSAVFQSSGRTYHGVHITGLHMGPGGQLLAYGTITGSNHPIAVWSIGGLIFRQTGAGQWEQALFEYGPVGKITQANGRAVATAYNAVLDSADGAGWNGYAMAQANVTLDGQPMDDETRWRLRVLDVEVLNDGTYVAQGARFTPFGDLPNVDTNFLLASYKLSSPTPFSGARNWTAYQEPYHGPFTKVGNNIVSAGSGGAWTTSSGGPGFTLTGPEVRAPGTSIAVSGASTAVAVESSEIVWKSTDSGGTWVKVWDKDIGPNLTPLGYFGGAFVAVGGNNDDLWFSHDNGASWQKGDSKFTGSPTSVVKGDGGKLFAPDGGNVLVSDDGGSTWSEKPIGASNGGFLLTRTPTGRLIMPVRGWDVSNAGKFHVSDDDGETWVPRNAGLAFGELVRAVVTTNSGRVLVATNTFSGFNPSLVYSDDDGETWTRSNVFRSLEGLDTVTGDPATKVTEILRMRVGTTGRILAMDENAIFTSDDDGRSWTVRTNMDFNGTGPFNLLRLRDVIQIGSRWIAVGSYSLDYPLSGNKHFLLISDDDGATWGMRPFETRQGNTFLYHLAEGANGRLIIAGGNGAIFLSDTEPPLDPNGAPLSVREGKTEHIPVSRPDVDGPVSANYITLGSTAQPDVDFIPVSGTLHWDADDPDDKTVALEMPDNAVVDGVRELSLQLAFETTGGLVGRIEVPVSIVDNDGPSLPGLVLDGADRLYTSEAGGTAELGIALRSKPTSDVMITITGLDESEGQLSATTFVFTPDNWGVMQTLTITGVDDPDPDGDATYNLQFVIDTLDSGYKALGQASVAVVNLGDEPLPSDRPVTVEFRLGAVEVPSGSLGVLVADTAGDGFHSPGASPGTPLSPGAVLGGDDVIVAVFTAAGREEWGGRRGFVGRAPETAYSTLGVAEGQALKLHVFPLRAAGDPLRNGEPHVSYRTDDPGDLTEDSTMGFALPAEGGVYRLAALGPMQGGSADLSTIDIAPFPLEEGRGQVQRTLSGGARHTFFLELAEPGLVSIAGNGGAGFKGELYGHEGQLIASSDGSGPFRFEENLEAGFHVLVLSGGASSYQVRLVTGTFFVRPDVAVGPSLSRLLGVRAYGAVAGQRAQLVSKKARKVKAFATVANRGNLADRIAVRAKPGNRFFKVTYHSGAGNLTSGLTRGTYVSPWVDDGNADFWIRATVAPDKKRLTRKNGSRKTFLKKAIRLDVRANSASAPSLIDNGRIEVKTK